MSYATHCFICDKVLQVKDSSSFSREVVAQVLRKVLGDGFYMVIKEEDELCQACQDTVFRIPKLEAELRTATLGLRALLRIKYSLDFPPDTEYKELKRAAVPSKPRGTLSQKLRKLQRSDPDYIIPLNGSNRKKKKLECVIGNYSENTEMTSDSENSLQNEVDNLIRAGNDTFSLVENSEEAKEDTLPCPPDLSQPEQMEEDKEERLFNTKLNHLDEEYNRCLKEEDCKLPYKCEMCSFESTTAKVMQNHYFSFKYKEGVQCEICELSFHHTELLKRHKAKHSNTDERRLCKLCSEHFHDLLHLHVHTEKKHRQEEDYIHMCAICYKCFLNPNTLELHVSVVHKKQPAITYTCRKCHESFTNKVDFANHAEYSHRDSLNCKFCEEKCNSIKDLTHHEKNCSKRIRGIMCRFCPRRFKYVEGLEAHEKLHAEDEVSECDEPGESDHANREHAVCDVCGLIFVNNHAFLKHRQCHDNYRKISG